MSFSFDTSAIRLEMDTRTKYLDRTIRFSADSIRKLRGIIGLPEFDIDALITLKLFLHILEEEVECLGLPHFSRCR